jgi:hypothetical protein
LEVLKSEVIPFVSRVVAFVAEVPLKFGERIVWSFATHGTLRVDVVRLFPAVFLFSEVLGRWDFAKARDRDGFVIAHVFLLPVIGAHKQLVAQAVRLSD